MIIYRIVIINFSWAGHSDKFWMNEETQLQNLLEDIQVYLGPFPDVKSLCEETIDDVCYMYISLDEIRGACR